MKRVASAAGFITELQESLSDEAYEDFKKALGTYRKVAIWKFLTFLGP